MNKKEQAPKFQKISRPNHSNEEKTYACHLLEWLMNNRKIKDEDWQRKSDNYGFVKIYWDKESNEK